MKVHIIFCNDDPKSAVTDKNGEDYLEEAKLAMETLRNRASSIALQQLGTSLEDYLCVHFWHIHTVNGE